MIGETESSVSHEAEADFISEEAVKQQWGDYTRGKVKENYRVMEKYEEKSGLYAFPANKQSCPHLDLSGDEVSKFTPDQCNSVAADLASYAIYINRSVGREKAILGWLQSRINLTIAPELENYQGYYSNEQRRALAIVGNDYATELEKMRMNSQLKVDMLDGLTYQINQQIRVLLSAEATKRSQKS